MLNDSCSTASFKKITVKKSTQRLGEKSVYESCLPIFRKFFDSRRIVPQSPLRWKERSSLLFFHQKGPAIIRGMEIFRGRRLFQILLTGSLSLNILFYSPTE